MDNKKLFAQYYGKIRREGIIKALLCGLTVGVGLSAIPAIVTLILNVNAFVTLLSSLIVLAGGTVVAVPIFYFTLFKPTIKTMVHRVDRTGLEERLVTMMEFEKDESYIAMVQREDAKSQLATRNSKSLKFSRVAMAPIIIALGASLALAGAMIPISATSVVGQSQWQQHDFVSGTYTEDSVIPDVDYTFLTVNFGVMLLVEEGTRVQNIEEYGIPGIYAIGGIPVMHFAPGVGGTIDGLSDQIIIYGQNAQTIIAVEDPGFTFLGFFTVGHVPVIINGVPLRRPADNSQIYVEMVVPVRPDGDTAELWYSLTLTNVTQHREIFVVFEVGSGGDGEGGPGDGEGDEPGDGEGDGDGDGQGDGPPGGAGGDGSGELPEHLCHNTMIDGQQSYRYAAQDQLALARSILSVGGELPPALRQLVERYYGSLANFQAS